VRPFTRRVWVCACLGALQVLDACDRPLFYQLKHMGAAECHFAYRMVVVMMRRDMPMPKVCAGAGSACERSLGALASVHSLQNAAWKCGTACAGACGGSGSYFCMLLLMVP
jgi:hypothetical protein